MTESEKGLQEVYEQLDDYEKIKFLEQAVQNLCLESKKEKSLIIILAHYSDFLKNNEDDTE